MAKKVKTPEEVKASIEKKAARRKLFFGTFTKALAFFLAIALTYTLAVIAFTPATTTGTVASNPGSTPTDSEDDPIDFGDDAQMPDGDTQTPTGDTQTSDGDTQTPSGGTQTPGGSTQTSGGQTAAKLTDAEIAKAVNDATAKAAKAGYHWARNCDYTNDGSIKVTAPILGDATDTLNGIIHIADPDADVNSVVGGFIGHGKKEADVPKGAKEVEGMDAKYMLRAMNLQASDFEQAAVSGNTYKIQLKNCNDPKKDGKNTLNHATDDFIVHEEVAQAITDNVGSALSLNSSSVTFSRILITAKIENGNLTDLQISYRFNAQLNLSMRITGTGKADTTIHYSNFKY